MFDDLRGFIDKVKELGEYKVIEGADWDLEIGVITEWQAGIPGSPLLLFDDIKGFPKGYRVVANLFGANNRAAFALGLPTDASKLDQVKLWRKIMRDLKPIPPVKVKSGPVMENIKTGKEVDLFAFPVPRWHQRDGGKYIGTGDVVIIKDPDEGWVNLGTYRVQIHKKDTATIYMSPGKHGDIIRRKYWAKGKSCPAAVSCGQEPMLFAWALFAPPWGVEEYAMAGGVKKKPIEVIEGVTTGLPIPATAEIVLEGEILPPGIEDLQEGPFGEWTGYYASGARSEPAFKVKSILHRHGPIIQGNAPVPFPLPNALGHDLQRSAALWDILDEQISGVRGVWVLDGAGDFSGLIISLEQKYAGHAIQAGMTAAGSRLSYMLRFVIVVDEDIDPTNWPEVVGALGTRCDPESSISIIKGCWGSPLDPRLPPEKRSRGQFDHSVAIILACKPYHWMKEFPPSTKTSPEVMGKIKEKWGKLFQIP